MASGELVPLQSTSALQPRFTTKNYQKAEAQLHASATKLKQQGGFQVQDQHTTRAMADQDRRMMQDFGGKLSQEQRGALHHVLGDNRFASVVGLAGAGKSTLLDTARMAWEQQGLRVHGAALAGKAAEGLQGASGIPSRTLASLELAWKNGHSPISKGDVLVVDEAGMIGTRQLARITKQIDEIGAKLVLVGDPEQLQPIEAGTPFRDLVENHGAARLTEIHRQKADWQKQASKDLAEGRSHQALLRYAEKKAVTTNTSKEDAIDHLAASYVMDVAAHGSQKSRLALAHKRKDVHALNHAIRSQLREGQPPDIEHLYHTETGPRAFAAGDRLVFGKNDKDLGVKNGMLGTVTEVRQGELAVTLDDDPKRDLRVNTHRYQHFDHGYAVTIHKSQGVTVDQAYLLASRSVDHHLAYVAMTRHKSDLQLYLDQSDLPKWA